MIRSKIGDLVGRSVIVIVSFECFEIIVDVS